MRREPSDGPLGLPPTTGGGLSALPDFGFAAACLVTWYRPTAFGDRMVHHIAMVMLLEFFVVHSAGFMGIVAASDLGRARRVLAMLGLAVLYTAFTAGYSIGFGSWWMVAAFWSLTLNRLSAVVFGVAPPDEQQTFVGVSWAASVLFYLGSIFATVVPDVPAFGITPDIVARQGFEVGGVWTEQPWRVVACGALYFFLQGCFEVACGVWFGFARRRPR